MADMTSQDMAGKLLAAGFERSGPAATALSDPIADTPMVVTLDQLRPYDHDPRMKRNPAYEEIKASIRERGLEMCIRDRLCSTARSTAPRCARAGTTSWPPALRVVPPSTWSPVLQSMRRRRFIASRPAPSTLQWHRRSRWPPEQAYPPRCV